MKPEIGKKYLLTTHNWFTAPDGDSYKAVFGTVHSIDSSVDALGVKTNAHSTNWYINIGNMLVAGCQVFYAIQTDYVNFSPVVGEIDFEGERKAAKNISSRIYNANLDQTGTFSFK